MPLALTRRHFLRDTTTGLTGVALAHLLNNETLAQLHLLALDHEKLIYYHNGTNCRLTDGQGQVIREVLA